MREPASQTERFPDELSLIRRKRNTWSFDFLELDSLCQGKSCQRVSAHVGDDLACEHASLCARPAPSDRIRTGVDARCDHRVD